MDLVVCTLRHDIVTPFVYDVLPVLAQIEAEPQAASGGPTGESRMQLAAAIELLNSALVLLQLLVWLPTVLRTTSCCLQIARCTRWSAAAACGCAVHTKLSAGRD